MSHFVANTLIRVHRRDGDPSVSFGQLESHYFQKIAYSPFDKLLYGIDGKHLVSITNGKPSKLAELEGKVFEREAMAVGVSPGILALLPTAKNALVIVPSYGVPWRFERGGLARLRAS